MKTFQSIGINKWLLKVCDQVGYEKPTKIQALAIPPILKGENVIANAETGSGKTATFSFPMLQDLAKDLYGIHTIILTPSRELALQINEQVSLFGQSIGLQTCVLVGGIDFIKQQNQLERIPHMIIGTPGRILDLLQKNLDFQNYIKNVKYFILDEADRLLDESLRNDILSINGYMLQQKQVILTSATIQQKKIKQEILEQLSQNEFQFYNVNQQLKTVETLDQKYLLIPKAVKEFYLIHYVQQHQDISIIIFVNTCKKANILNLLFQELGIESTCLHSKLIQLQRTSNLKKFKNSKKNILICTDIASRGLDIPTVALVINYEVPRKIEDYIHRVGRTARKGKRGQSVTFITQYDVQLLINIEKKINVKMQKIELNEQKVLENMNEIIKTKKKIKIKMSENGQDQIYLKK